MREPAKRVGRKTDAPILSLAKQENRLAHTLWRPGDISLVAIVIASLIIGSCAKEKEDAWLRDKAEVMQTLNRISNKQRDQYTDLEKRVRKLAQRSAQTEFELSRLEDNMQRLESSNKKSAEELTKKLKKLETSLRTRHRNQLPSAPKTAVHKSSPKISVSPAASPPAKPTAKPVDKDSYITAYLALKGGQYETASATFEKFLSAYPNDEYSDQAFYWLGVSYLAQKKPRKAIKAFLKVATNFPKGSKHKLALLKLGQTYEELHRKKDARIFLNRLLAEHPGSPEAKIARQRLAVLNSGKNQ